MAKNSTFDVTSDRRPPGGRQRREPGARRRSRSATTSRAPPPRSTSARSTGTLTLLADDEYKLKALVDVLQSKLIKRGVPIRNLDYGKVEPASAGKARQVVTLQQGISTEKGKEIVKAIKAGGFKKVQAQIQDDQVRVQSPSIDELQAVIAMLKQEDFGLELQFGNFRS